MASPTEAHKIDGLLGAPGVEVLVALESFISGKESGLHIQRQDSSMLEFVYQGQVVQSTISLMSLLRGQLIKSFTTLQPNALIFFAEKLREAFAVQKLLTFFQQKNIGIF